MNLPIALINIPFYSKHACPVLRTKWCTLFWALPFLLPAQNNEIRFQRLSTKEGLPGNNVIAMTQDQDGFLWVGTPEGLAKYDGYEFQTYRSIPGDSTSLNNDWIESLYVDSEGYLWVGTVTGLNRYEPRCDCFTRYDADPSTPNRLPAGQVTAFVEDLDHRLWVGTEEGGLFRYERESERFTRFLHDPEALVHLNDDQVRVLFVDRENHLWIGTGEPFGSFSGGGLIRFDPATGTAERFVHDPANQNSLIDNRVGALWQDREGRIWIGTCKSGLQYYDPIRKEFIRMRPNSVGAQNLFAPQTETGVSGGCPLVRILHQDQRGAFWVGTYNGGINYYDPATKKYTHLFHDPNDPLSLSKDEVWSIYEDRQGRIWIGSMYGGLDMMDPSLNKFKVYINAPADPVSLSHNDVLAIHESLGEPGIIWVGTRGGGLNRLDLRTNEFSHFRRDSNDDNSIGSDIVWSIFEDRSGILWVGTEEGLDYLDRQTGKFRHYTHKPNDTYGLPAGPVISIYEDREGFLWIATLPTGISRFDRDKKDFRHFNFSSSTESDFDRNTFYLILEDREGNLWAGSRRGNLYRYDRQKETFTPQMEREFGAVCLHEDRNGWFWIGTINDGLLHFNPANATFRQYTVKEGLPNNGIYGILEDDLGRYWVSTGKGISKFEPQSQSFTNYDLSDRVPNYDFNVRSAVKNTDGRLFFGGPGGLVAFLPDTISENRYPPDVFIKGLRIFGEFYDLGNSINEKPAKITLSYRQNDLTFEYIGLHYTNPLKNQYKYRLKPYDQDWIDAGVQRTARYTKLDPGTYTFQVTAANSDGYWNEVGASIEIYIYPPWWRTWWAKSAFFLLVIAGLFGLFHWRAREHQKKLLEATRLNERLQQVDKLKDQFLANTSHELRTPLQGIIGLSESLIERVEKTDQQEDLSMIISSGKRLNNLVNDILDFSKLRNYDLQLNQKPVELHALVDVLLKVNAPLVKGKNLRLVNAVSPDLYPVYADENRLQQILYNLIGNAIKFTETGCVKISATQEEESIRVAVEDTGTGIPENKLDDIFKEFEQGDGSVSREFTGTGLGLSISKRLVELHSGEMWVVSEMGTGSTFFFTLPASKEKASTLASSGETLTNIVSATTVVRGTVTAPSISGNSENPVRILVVDDEPINQQVLRNHLSAQGFQLIQAMNGNEALEAVQNRGPFDLILLDVMMPRMSGYEVCQKIREKYLPSELPVIMVTAKDQLQDIVQGLSLGANDYLPKPFYKEELLARINTQLDLHRIFNVTGRFVPNEFLRSLNRASITEVTLGDHTEREVTVLFSDIRDYTSLAETMTPEENFNFINAFHRRMGPVIKKHGGFINQYLGDAIMAIFPNTPEDALKAAVEMQEVLRTYNAQRRSRRRPSLKMGIGLHSGPLIMGIIGDQHRLDAATIADAVNTTSRVEGLTKYYGASILLTDDSLDRMGDQADFHFRYLGQVLVKGKKEPVGIFECLDGDPPEIKEKKLTTKAQFDQGLEAFFGKEFAQAAVHLKTVLKQLPEDQAAQLFYKKTGEYITQGVPEDWTGVEVMTFK